MKRTLALLPLLVALSACQAPSGDASRSESAEPKTGDAMDRARVLAQTFIIADGHIDLPYRLQEQMDDVAERTETGDFDFPRATQGGLDAPFMSIYVPAHYEQTGGAKALADELIDIVAKITLDAPDKFALATTEAEIRAHSAAGRVSLLLGMENGAPLEGDLENLRHFYERGVRYITLTHSKDNHICDSSYDESQTWGGLSPFGEQVVAEMNRLGMMIDISHVTDAAANQVLDRSAAPVIASHSSCRTFTPDFERNISDELLRRLAENGGVAMINFGSSFLDGTIRELSSVAWKHVEEWAETNGYAPDDEHVTEYRNRHFAENHPGYADVSLVADHIAHAVEVAGIDHVGFGSDFDGVGDSLPTGLKDVADYPNLIRELIERGFSDEQIEKICSGNLFRVMREVARVAAERRES